MSYAQIGHSASLFVVFVFSLFSVKSTFWLGEVSVTAHLPVRVPPAKCTSLQANLGQANRCLALKKPATTVLRAQECPFPVLAHLELPRNLGNTRRAKKHPKFLRFFIPFSHFPAYCVGQSGFFSGTCQAQKTAQTTVIAEIGSSHTLAKTGPRLSIATSTGSHRPCIRFLRGTGTHRQAERFG